MFFSCGSSRTGGSTSIDIENNVFRLHYKATVFILVVLSVIINYKQFIQSSPISCVEGTQLMNDHCWTNSYLNLPVPKSGTEGNEVFTTKNNQKVYNHFYQWVGFWMLFQAVLFFLPHYLWKYCFEGGRLKSILRNLSDITPDESTREVALEKIEYLGQNLGQNKTYAYTFFICEILNFTNVVLQFVVTDCVLNHEFISLGTKALKGSDNSVDSNNRMPTAFPKKVFCEWAQFAKSSTASTTNTLCVLSFNVFIEKAYVFLWFWLIFLIIASGLQCIYSILVEFLPSLRNFLLQEKLRLVREKLVGSSEKLEQNEEIIEEAILKQLETTCQTGDWFLLYQLGKNMDLADFGYLLKGYSQAEKIRRGSLTARSDDEKGNYESIAIDD